MYEFRCGSPVCKTHFTAPTEDELMGEVARHVAVKHHIPAPTQVAGAVPQGQHHPRGPTDGEGRVNR